MKKQASNIQQHEKSLIFFYPRLPQCLKRRIQRRATICRLRLGLVLQNLLDARKYLGRELRQHLEGLEVVRNLLRAGGTEDDCRRVWLLRDPRECEVVDFAAKLCG